VKKLTLVLVLVLALSISAMAQVDTLNTIISSSAWLIIPAFDGANKYDWDVGMSFGIDRVMGDNVTLGVIYTKWRANGQDTADIKGNLTAARFSYWAYEFGSKYNFCVNMMPGYGKIANGNENKEVFSLVSSVGIMYRVFPGAYARFNWGIGKYGNSEQDAFGCDLGFTFKWD